MRAARLECDHRRTLSLVPLARMVAQNSRTLLLGVWSVRGVGVASVTKLDTTSGQPDEAGAWSASCAVVNAALASAFGPPSQSTCSANSSASTATGEFCGRTLRAFSRGVRQAAPTPLPSVYEDYAAEQTLWLVAGASAWSAGITDTTLPGQCHPTSVDAEADCGCLAIAEHEGRAKGRQRQTTYNYPRIPGARCSALNGLGRLVASLLDWPFRCRTAPAPDSTPSRPSLPSLRAAAASYWKQPRTRAVVVDKRQVFGFDEGHRGGIWTNPLARDLLRSRFLTSIVTLCLPGGEEVCTGSLRRKLPGPSVLSPITHAELNSLVGGQEKEHILSLPLMGPPFTTRSARPRRRLAQSGPPKLSTSSSIGSQDLDGKGGVVHPDTLDDQMSSTQNLHAESTEQDEDQILGYSETTSPVHPDDIATWDAQHPSGGLLVSTHMPKLAEAWLDQHQQEIPPPPGEVAGPFSFQLTPLQEAYVVFSDDVARIQSWMKTIANKSGLTVICRPANENPLGLKKMTRLRGGSKESETSKASTEQIGSLLRNLKASQVAEPIAIDAGSDSSTWTPKDHSAILRVTLEKEPESPRIAILVKFRFDRIHRRGQPEPKVYNCVASTKIDAQFPNQFFLDRSCSNVGFEVHRHNAIKEYLRFIPEEFEDSLPTKKHTKETNWSRTINIGGTAAHAPSAPINIQWTKGGKQGEEQQNPRPPAQCLVKSNRGPVWSPFNNNKSFESWNFSWCPNNNQYGEQYDATVEFDIMLNLHHKPKTLSGQTRISCMMRNQIMIWDCHPVGSIGVPHPRLSGFMLVASTYIPDVFIEEELDITEDIMLQHDGKSDDITQLQTGESQSHNVAKSQVSLCVTNN
uniref:Uncharacterized protein n=1 Tax=Mycena chlorophos TaxID=658473 RepID=A0ABQ0L1S4_MYCCL|nr:predicted protein [Mycena chlorophos]